MRSTDQALAVVLLMLPGLFASCSDDETNEGQVGGGAAAEAGESGSAQAGAESGGGPSEFGGQPAVGGASGSEPSSAGTQAAGGETGQGGAVGGEAGQGGATKTGDGGKPNEGGAWSGGGGEPTSGGSGGEAGASAAGEPVILFDGGAHDGLNFGGRLGLDQHCAAAKLAQSIPGSSTHALISVSATDELRDMPSLYGLPIDRAFVGPTGKKVADDFADLLDGSLDQSLTSADVSSAQFWISGSNADGTVRKTCDGWTSSEFSQLVTGSYGYPGSADSNWLTVTGGDVYCSASQYTVICAAFD
jgi:hypothetical protein